LARVEWTEGAVRDLGKLGLSKSAPKQVSIPLSLWERVGVREPTLFLTLPIEEEGRNQDF